MKRALFAVLVVAAMAAHAAAFWLAAGSTCAEAHTGFAYARSLAEGRGLALSPGAERCEGSSSLLWILLLSFGAGHGVDPATAAQASGLLCTLACLVLIAVLPARLGSREPEPADVLPPLLLAILAPTVSASVGGLDAPLYTLLLLAALLRFTHEAGQARPMPLSAGLLFLAALTRPEAALVGLLAVPAVLWAHRGNSLASLEWTGAFVGLLAAFQVWRMLYFGEALPSALKAFSLALQSAQGDAWARLWNCLSAGWPSYVALLAAYGVIRLAATTPCGLWTAGTLAASGLVAATAVHPTASQALAPAVPFLLLGLREGLDRFVRFLYSPDPVRLGRDLPTLATAATVALVVARLGVPAFDSLTCAFPPEVDQARHQLEQGRAFARIARHAGLTAATIASEAAAGLAWSSGLETIDLSGGSDRTLSAHGGSPFVRDEYLLEQRRPTFIRLTADGARTRHLASSSTLAANYVRLPPLPGDGPHDENYMRRDVFSADPREPAEFRSGACFGGQLALEGLSRINAVAAPGGRLELLLYWRALSPDPGIHRIEVALAGPARIARTHALGLGWLPANRWRPGERIRERLLLEVPRTAREGDYQVVVSVLGPDGSALGTTAPGGCELVVSAKAARQRSLQLAESVGCGGPPAARVTTWHRIRQIELAGTWTEHEMTRLHERACLELERRGLLELATGEAPLDRRTREAAACLMQARAWGGEASGLGDKLAATLLERGLALAGRGDARAATRELTLAARVAPTNLQVLQARDSLWEELATSAREPSRERTAPVQPPLARSPRGGAAVTVASAAQDGAVRQ